MKRTSKKWCKKLGLMLSWIFNPDGWNRTNLNYSFNEEKITKEEFVDRLSASTVKLMPPILKLFEGER